MSSWTLDKENPTIEETSSSSIHQIVPNGEHVSSDDIVKQETSSAGGQAGIKVVGFVKGRPIVLDTDLTEAGRSSSEANKILDQEIRW
jgi:hypothetical protein